MAAWLMLTVQAVAGPPAPVARAPVERPCPVAKPGEEIIVCGRSGDAFRLKPMPDRYAPERAPPKAETAINGVGTLAAEAERAADAQGAPINRAMIRLRVPIGTVKR